MACPVGLSSGDLVYVGTAFKRIYDSFRGGDDSASAQFKALCDEFDGFHASFSQLDRALKIVGKPRPQYFHAIQSTFRRCGDLVRKYETLDTDRGTSLAKITKTLTWLLKDKTIEDLRKNLTAHSIVMTGMVLAENLEITHKLHGKHASAAPEATATAVNPRQETATRNETTASASSAISLAEFNPNELPRLINSMTLQMQSMSQRLAETDDSLRRYSTAVDNIYSKSVPSTPGTRPRPISEHLSALTPTTSPPAELDEPLRTKISSEIHSCIERLAHCDKMYSHARTYSVDSAYGSAIGSVPSQDTSPYLSPTLSTSLRSTSSNSCSPIDYQRRATFNGGERQNTLTSLPDTVQRHDFTFLDQNGALPPPALSGPLATQTTSQCVPDEFYSPDQLALPPSRFFSELPGSEPAWMPQYLHPNVEPVSGEPMSIENFSREPMNARVLSNRESLVSSAINWEYFSTVVKFKRLGSCGQCGSKCPYAMQIHKEGEWLCALRVICLQSKKVLATQSFLGYPKLSLYITPHATKDGELRANFRLPSGSATPKPGDLPFYDFANESDLNKFQELVSSRKLLYSCEVLEISGDIHKECNAETLQLWGEYDSNVSYLRFYSSIRRKEFFEEPRTSFRDAERKSGGRVRVTIVKPSPANSRRGSTDTAGSSGSARSKGTKLPRTPTCLNISFKSPADQDNFLKAWKSL